MTEKNARNERETPQERGGVRGGQDGHGQLVYQVASDQRQTIAALAISKLVSDWRPGPLGRTRCLCLDEFRALSQPGKAALLASQMEAAQVWKCNQAKGCRW
ncbi:hypothetical protein HYQ46_010396 [Verticillium longisporum]|nr:hypothetical protein HYQ46_010396 [Verticillium longisporum]